MNGVLLQPLVEPSQTIEKGQHLDATFMPTAVAQVKQVYFGLGKINPETLQSPHIVRPNVVCHSYLEGPNRKNFA